LDVNTLDAARRNIERLNEETIAKTGTQYANIDDIRSRFDARRAEIIGWDAKATEAQLELIRQVNTPLDLLMSTGAVARGGASAGDYVTVGASALPGVGKVGGAVLRSVPLKRGLTAAQRLAASASRGRAFEKAGLEGILGHVGPGKKTGAVTEVLPNGRTVTTILDVAGRPVGLVEFKDVARLSRSDQFAAQLQHAVRTRTPYYLVVSPNTKTISRPLLRQIDAVTSRFGGGVYRYDPATDVLTPWTP
jgi:hypothetical protein